MVTINVPRRVVYMAGAAHYLSRGGCNALFAWLLDNGLLILALCLVVRLAKRCVDTGIVWALLSIAYTVGFHVGIVLIVIGLLWR